MCKKCRVLSRSLLTELDIWSCGNKNLLTILLESQNVLNFENVYAIIFEMFMSSNECQRQNNIRTYICMGRHKNIHSFYVCELTQKFHKMYLISQSYVGSTHTYIDSIHDGI